MPRSDPLATYNAKRNFDLTREPRGDARHRASRAAPRFVVQKHAARRLHYDLRLEVDGVYKSWALTRGPSLDPRIKRLAMQTEDHPLAYGKFEGSIPAGEYGGGTVQLWDRGHWRPLEEEDAAQALAAGKLDFVLAGTRLEGAWTLVRMRERRPNSKRAGWLLIKRRDAYAREGADARLLAETHSIATGRDMQAIAAGAPARLARHAGGAPPRRSSRRADGAPPAFLPLALCKLVARPPHGAGWVHEIKFDGYRMQLRVVDGKASLRTRSGLDWSARFPALLAAAAELRDCVLDGEVVALDAAGQTDFAALQAALSSARTEALVFFAFDALYSGGKDLRERALTARKSALQRLLASVPRDAVLRYVEHFTTAGEAVLASACRLDLEGIVSKRADAPYRAGRTGVWTKSKCRAGQEVVIGGWATTDGRFRSLLVGVYDDDALVYAGRVGTGFSARLRAPLEARLAALDRARSPFVGGNALAAGPDVHWVRPTLVAEVEFAGWTADGLLRQAAYKGLREDKPAHEVRRERATTPRSTRSPRTAPRGVTLSHPDKIIWPATENSMAYDKAALADYYDAMAERLLAHLGGRPCSLVRCPNGVTGERFFQRHALRGGSNLLDAVRVAGDRRPYLVINRPEALVALAQVAAVELHPWNCAPDEPSVPGRLVFDLDPAPGLPFERVIEAALELRERLRAIGLQPFCKTTGGKGLHVVTPLVTRGRARVDWPSAKQFSRALCAAMVHDAPARYVVNMSKRKREGRIFLDYLRNDRMATAVAPWSPRAHAGAPVATPVAWRAVKPGLAPDAFDLATVTPRTRDAWSGYADAAGDLRAALRRLGQVDA
ncbi:MAG: DNA ligase D [Gammaproteobacteria bacterium]